MEEIQITYSYWDGSGHRKNVKVESRGEGEGEMGGGGRERVVETRRIGLNQCQHILALRSRYSLYS